MFLEKPSFPVSLSQGEAEEKVSALLNKKNWTNFSFTKTKLVFVPYWFFNYHISKDSEDKTELIGDGFNAMNAFENDFDQEVADVARNPDLTKTNEVSEDNEFNVLNSKTTEQEAREIILVKLADQQQVPRDSILLSGLERNYVPFWIVKVRIGEKELGLTVNASDGKLLHDDLIPNREKGMSELTSEALKELSNPLEWLNYSKDIASSVAKGLFSHSPKKTHSGDHALALNNQDMQILILGVIAILVIIWAIYLR